MLIKPDMIFIEQPEWFYFPDTSDSLEELYTLSKENGIPLISNVEEIYKFKLLTKNLSRGCKDHINPLQNIFFSKKETLIDHLKDLKKGAKILICGAHLIKKESEYFGCVSRAVGLINRLVKDISGGCSYFIDGNYIVRFTSKKTYEVTNVNLLAFPQFSIKLSEVL